MYINAIYNYIIKSKTRSGLMGKFNVEKKLFTEHGACAITSIIRGKKGKLYLGFTSDDYPVAEYDIATGTHRYINLLFNQPPNNIKCLDKVHNSFAMDENGVLYVGQGLNINWDAAPYSFNLRKHGGGHLFAYDTNTEKVTDFGVMIPLNAIHGITYNKKTRCIYGYTIPDNHFFRFHIDSGKVTDYGKISDYACHNFITDDDGNAYGAWFKKHYSDDAELALPRIIKGTYLLKYDCAKDELIRTQNMIAYGLEYDIFANVGMDTWIRTKDGDVFGATTIGGYIFKVNNDDSIQYVGKPVLGPRLTSMVEGEDGLIYGCGGFPHMSLFTLNPKTYEIVDHGILSTEGQYWYMHCITMEDGVIYGGETDAGKACLITITPK